MVIIEDITSECTVVRETQTAVTNFDGSIITSLDD